MPTHTFSSSPAADLAAEESRLDRAMRQADDLLLSSLRDAEAQRHRRRRLVIGAALFGGIVMILAITAVLMGLIGNAATTAGADDDQAAALAQEGWALWQRGEAEAAQLKFASAVELDPKNANTWNGLGWSRLRS